MFIIFAICDIKYPKKFKCFFLNASNYDYHFINKELTKEFEGQIKYREIFNFFSTN